MNRHNARQLPEVAGLFTKKQRTRLERALPWLPASAEIGQRLEAMQEWLHDEAVDIAERGDGVVAPSVGAMLSEAASDLAHAGELRSIALRALKAGKEQELPQKAMIE